MKQLDIDGLRAVQFEILCVVADFCDKNGIKYFLNAGTLLGAVRHKGFIPWDNDIDIGMLRPDYDKFIELFNKSNTRYELHCRELKPEYPRPYGKVFDKTTFLTSAGNYKHCINIDLWVMDNAPDDNVKLIKMWFWQKVYKRLYFFQLFHCSFPKYEGHVIRFLKKVIYQIVYEPIRCFLRDDYFAGKVIENSRRYVSENTIRVGNFVGDQLAVIAREKLANTIDGEFEGRKFKIPSGYDEWLRSLYGDYMQLPPEDERVPHGNIGFVKEEND